MVNAAKQTAGKVLRDGLMMKHSFIGDTHGHYLVCSVYLSVDIWRPLTTMRPWHPLFPFAVRGAT